MEEDNRILKIIVNSIIIISFLCFICTITAWAHQEKMESSFDFEPYIIPTMGLSILSIIISNKIDKKNHLK